MSKEYLRRNIDKELQEWKTSSIRKPLPLRGARQVGKSSTIRAFGKQFDYFLEINKGSIQSMFQFLSEKKYEFGIRCSMENFGMFQNIKIYPLYAVSWIGKLANHHSQTT